MLRENFIDPYTRDPLEKNSEGHLYRQANKSKVVYKSYDGCYDFVVSSPDLQGEQAHYENQHSALATRQLTLDLIRGLGLTRQFHGTRLCLKALATCQVSESFCSVTVGRTRSCIFCISVRALCIPTFLSKPSDV